MVPYGRKVNPATIEKFTRPRYAQPQVGRGPEDDEEEEPINEPPMDQPHYEPMLPMFPSAPQADPYVDQHLGHIVRHNEFIIGSLIHQQQVNANFHAYQVVMVDKINAIGAHMNISNRIPVLPRYKSFDEQPPANPFNEDWDD